VSHASLHQVGLTQEFVDDIRARLIAGQPVRCDLPGGGSLYMDRPLPFMCVYRQPAAEDVGTRELVHGEASYLIVPHSTSKKELSLLLKTVIDCQRERFNAFLIIEIWSAADDEVKTAFAESALEPTEFRPSFLIVARSPHTPMRTIEALRRQLEKISYLKQTAAVRVDTSTKAPEGSLATLLNPKILNEWGCEVVGVCVRPIYRNHQTGELYPAVQRLLKRHIGRALKQAFFAFSKVHTNSAPEHFYSLGRRTILNSVKFVDRRLNEISKSFSFLLQVTPVNAEAAWHEFHHSHFESEPRYYYRPLAMEPSELKLQLFKLAINNIEDPTLSELFHQRQDELDRKITMLSDVGTKRFVYGSQQVYGELTPGLLSLAQSLLERINAHNREDMSGGEVNATEFAKQARKEVAYYKNLLPEFTAEVVIRDDMYSGLMCSDGHLLIGRDAKIPKTRVQALIQHEVGTHLLTYYNGLLEPFKLLHTGLAGYDSLQEGIAVLSEYLVGGLSKPRLRLLAGRVLAVHMLIEGATFVETFRALSKEFGFNQRVAYTITMRVYRGGGFTKDAVYLRGLVEILDYLGQGGTLDPLFVGKIASEHIRFVRELLHRKVILPAVLQPRYLQFPGVAERLEKLSAGMTVLNLIED
jgi:uncharacterized protein (TIGR02421 family)